ncbi:MAG: cobalt-precorrin 5A hydrolase [Candidatus Bathyarchaeia archaeon]|jgi:cobalt-precorrin 5A hydrolase
MYNKEISIIAATSRGVETALKIQNALAALELPSKVYAPNKYIQTGVNPVTQKLDKFIQEAFTSSSALVTVMATGIVIRAVAPCLKSKLADPAVVAVDANGKFAISLLSGHFGGANHLTRQIAAGIGATTVITTASDSMGKQGADELARTMHLTIVNPKSLVGVNAALVNEERLALIRVGDARVPLQAIEGYTTEEAKDMHQAVEIANRYDTAAIITHEPLPPEEASEPVVLLKPKRIVIGVGARKEITQTQILKAINVALVRVNLPLERVDGLATVDIKRDSQGMLAAAEKLGLKFDFFSVEELCAVRNAELSPDSELVQEKIGVGGVCERAALIAAGKNPHLILKKQKLNGVTVAVAEGE